MNYDLISRYMNYKVKLLTDCGLIFFPDYNKKFLRGAFNSLFTTYINTYYYHILDTLEYDIDYDQETLKKEYEGKKYEILEEFAEDELVLSNEEYTKNKNAIDDIIDIALFLVELDQLKYENKEEIAYKVAKFVEEYPKIDEKLQNNIYKLIYRIKQNYNVDYKLFKEDNPQFIIDYSKTISNKGYIIVNLLPNIKILNTNYKKNLVYKVYNKEELIIKKMSTLIYKLSRDILDKALNGKKIDKYFIDIDESLFQKGKLIVIDALDNKLLRDHIVLMITNNSYKAHQEYLRSLNFSFACKQDLSNIYNVLEKLGDIDQQMFFDYIVVDKYKDKDEEYLINFSCREGVEFFVLEEGEE